MTYRTLSWLWYPTLSICQTSFLPYLLAQIRTFDTKLILFIYFCTSTTEVIILSYSLLLASRAGSTLNTKLIKISLKCRHIYCPHTLCNIDKRWRAMIFGPISHNSVKSLNCHWNEKSTLIYYEIKENVYVRIEKSGLPELQKVLFNVYIRFLNFRYYNELNLSLNVNK